MIYQPYDSLRKKRQINKKQRKVARLACLSVLKTVMGIDARIGSIPIPSAKIMGEPVGVSAVDGSIP